MRKNRLVVKHLAKRFGRKWGVRDVSFQAKEGEVAGLLGPNGAGKTTSFYMIAGIINAEKGKVMLNDQDISLFSMPERARLGIGYLPQEASIFRGMTVEQNIRSIAQFLYNDKRRQWQITEELLERFDLKPIRKSKGYSLSGGERRRTEIARALVAKPKFLLLDEPFAGIDPIVVGQIKKIIRELAREGIGIVITDHNVRDAFDVTDTVCIINEGRVIACSKPQEIAKNRTVQSIYLGKDFKL